MIGIKKPEGDDWNKKNLTVKIGMTEPQPTADAIPTRIKKMSRGEANAKTLSKKTQFDCLMM